MSRAEMIDALGKMGFDTSTITDGVPDEVLAQMLAALPTEPSPAPDAAMADMSRDDMIAALQQAGYDPNELTGLSDEDLKALYDAEFPPEAAPAAAPVATMSERTPKKKEERVIKFSEISGLIASLVDAASKGIEKRFEMKLGAIRRQTASLDGNAKKSAVVKFCEALREEGKILPLNFDSVVARLLRADHVRRVHKFSEGGKTSYLTELDLQQDELRRGPILASFAERMKQPTSTTDSEVAAVENHFESFSESYKRISHTKEKMVAAYKIARRDNPRLTAKEFFTVPGSY